MAASAPRLLAISDLHVSRKDNRDGLLNVGAHPDDWLIVAGDVGEKPEHLQWALDALQPKFARLIWTAGNHDLWTGSAGSAGSAGPAGPTGPKRYDELVAMCRARGVITPEDPYVEWPGEPGTFIVPMFLLFDYSFRPPEVPLESAVAWARETGVRSTDDRQIDASPWPSMTAWCHARCDATEARLDALPGNSRTVLINHWPLRYDLARPPRVPRFSVWSGTTRTENWAQKYRARVVVSGHLHFRTTLWRHGVRYEEVSLGYPRDWRHEHGVDWYLREILPGDGPDANRFVPPIDPFQGRFRR